MSYAIFRVEKLKSRGEVSGSGGHMSRSRPTPNADPERVSQNEILRGSSDPAADVDQRLAELDRTPGKNSVLTLEVLATASPEWFDQATDDAIQSWKDQTQQWLDETFGADNVVALRVHNDEETPHITGFVVPAKHDKKGALRLSAAHWVDGGKKLAQLQDGYADAVQDLGIKRGVRGSKAEHTTIREYYGQITSDRKDLSEPLEAMKLGATAETDRRKRREYQKTAERQAERIDKLQEENRRLRQTADRVRDVPLDDVAVELGLQRDPDDRAKWHTSEGDQAISINGQQFYDHKRERGGGGAIDLVKHVLQRSFQAAVSWLADRFGADAAGDAYIYASFQKADGFARKVAKDIPPFEPPQDHPQHRDRVRHYLVQRGIDGDLIDDVMDRGKIRADDKANAVALMHHSDGSCGGAEKRGTGRKPFHGLERGSSRDASFYIAGDGPIRRVVLTESAIDALSYASLHGLEDGVAVASASGAKHQLPRCWECDGLAVTIAYDNDDPGREASDVLKHQLEERGFDVRIERPDRKDWNDDLRADRRASKPFPSSKQQPSAPSGAPIAEPSGSADLEGDEPANPGMSGP